jgi:hypothetical protein
MMPPRAFWLGLLGGLIVIGLIVIWLVFGLWIVLTLGERL